MKRILAIWVLLLLAHCLHAQDNHFSVEHYTVASGLPSGITNDMSWDSDGSMWVSTLKGIARFDGIRMEYFMGNNNPRIGDYVSPLSADDDGKSIFCDGVNNIYGFRDGKPVLVDSSYRVGTEGGNHFALPLPRRFWNPVLLRYNDSFAHQNAPIPVDDYHFVIALRNTLLRYDRRTKSYTAIKSFAGDITLFQMGNSLYLYESDRSINKIVFSGPEGLLSSQPVKLSFALLHTKIYWRNGMETGIQVEQRQAYRLYWQNGRFMRELICDELPNDIYIENIKYDVRTQTTAIASDGDGIYLYRKKPLKSYVQRTAGILAHVYSFYSQFEWQPGKLWLDADKILDLNGNRFYSEKGLPVFKSAYRVKDSLALFHVISQTDPDEVWSYSFKTRKFTRRFGTPNTSSGAFAMTENRLFFADDHRLTEMSSSKDSTFFSFAVLGSNTISMARDMAEIRPGYLLICGEIGVFGFDIHTKKIDTLLPGYPAHTFRQICRYKGYVFLAQYGTGIWVLQGRKAGLLPLDKNQYLRWASNIFIDRDHNAWIAANAGIFKISADSLLTVSPLMYAGPSHYLVCEYYGKDDGLALSELNGGRQGSMIRLSNGLLSYVGINGIVTVDISGKKTSSRPLKITADRILADDKEMPDSVLRSGTSFDAHTKNIKVFVNIPIWTSLQNVMTEYRISGYSDRWEEFDYARQNFIECKNLPYGDYVLQVRAISAADRSHPADFSFPFSIATPWYKTAPFGILLLILTLLAIWGLFRWRLYYLRKKTELLERQIAIQVKAINSQKAELEEQIVDMEAYQARLEKDYALKNRLISIIGHDIITPLRFMNRAGKALLTKRDSISQTTFDETLQTILATGMGLQDMAANMLSWIKHHNDTMQFVLSEFDLGEKVDEIIRQIKPMADLKHLVLCSRIPRGVSVRQYGDPIKTIVLQLLTNAIKYSEQGTIMTDAAISGGNLLLTVTDTGIGMPPRLAARLAGSGEPGDFAGFHENTGHGFGFLIIRDMLEIIHGDLQIASVVDQGTEISIRFPASLA